MCRRLVIDCEWDDENPQDAAGMFYHVENFNILNPWFEHQLRDLITSKFQGQVTITIEKLHGQV